MPFDPTTAQPVDAAPTKTKFDPSTAKPVESASSGLMNETPAAPAPEQDHGGWGRFAATTAAHAIAGAADTVVGGIVGDETGESAPYTKAADKLLDKASLKYEPKDTASRIGEAATEGAIGAVATGGRSLVKDAVGAVKSAATGAAVGATQEVANDTLPEPVARLLPALMPLLARGKSPTEAQAAETRARKLLTDAGVPADQHDFIIQRAKTQLAPDFTRSGEALKTADAGKTSQEQGKAGEVAQGQRSTDLKAASAQRGRVRQTLDQTAAKGLNQIRAAVAKNKPGDFPHYAAQLLTSTRSELGAHFRERYGEGVGPSSDPRTEQYRSALTQPVDTAPITATVQDFLSKLPAELKGMFPDAAKKLERLLPTEEAGEAETPKLTLGEAHYLRSQLRDMRGDPDLNATFKQHQLSRLETAVNDAINSKGNNPEVRKAASYLKDVDAEYKQKMPQFRSSAYGLIADNMKPGFPENVHVAKQLAKGGNAAALGKMMQMGGAEFKSRFGGALLKDALGESRIDVQGRGPGYHDPAAILQHIKQYKAGYEAAFGAKAVKSWTDALTLSAARDGRIPAGFGMPKDAGSFSRLLDEEKRLDARVTELVKQDPLEALAGKSGDPALIQSGASGHAAALRILRDPVLAQRAIDRFGMNSEPIRTLKGELVQHLIAPIVNGKAGGLETALGKVKYDTLTKFFSPADVGAIRTIAEKMIEKSPVDEAAERTARMVMSHTIGGYLTSMLMAGKTNLLQPMARAVTLDPANIPKVRAQIMAAAAAAHGPIDQGDDDADIDTR